MPDVRCRYGGDCKNAKRNVCRFVHPDDPIWNKLSSKGSLRSSGSSDWNTHSPEVTASNKTPITEGKNRWNFPDASKSGNNDNTGTSPTNSVAVWNFTPTAKATHPTNNLANAESSSNSTSWPTSRGQNSTSKSSGGGWGDNWGSWGSGNKASSTSNGADWTTGEAKWGGLGSASSTTNVAGGGGCWGNGATANTLEKDKSSRGSGEWGSGSLIEKSEGSCNQPLDNGWSGMGSGQSSIWNGDGSIQPKDKSPNVQIHHPSPQSPILSKPSASSTAQKTTQKSDLSRLQLAASCNSPIPDSLQRTPLSSVPLSVFQIKPPQAVAFKKSALEASKESSQSGSVSAKSLKCRGPKGRKALYASSIKHIYNAVLFHLEVHKLQDDLERWRRTQNSSIYGHSSQKTRKILDTERSGYSQQLQEAKIKFQHEINSLINLPDFFDQHKSSLKSALTKEVVAAYTQELQDWFTDLELHKRLLVEKAEEENEEGEVRNTLQLEMEEGEVMEEEEVSGLKPSDLRRQGKWTWKELRGAIDILEGRVAVAEENYYFDVFTSIQDDKEDELHRVKMRLEACKRKNPAESVDVSSVWNALDDVGNRIENQSQDLAQLLQKFDELEKELSLLLQEKARMDPIIEQADKQFEEFESWKETDASQISEMTEQIRSLHLYKEKPTSASSMSGSTTITPTTNPVSQSSMPSSSAQHPEPQPVTVIGLLEYVRPLIVDILQSDLMPVFETLRQRCAENQHRLQVELEEETTKILDLSQAVKAKIDIKGDVSALPTVPPITNLVDVSQL